MLTVPSECLGKEVKQLRRISTFSLALLAISAFMVITPVWASAIRTPIAGNVTLSVTSIGDIRITKSGILHQADAEASGPVTGDFTGEMQIELSANFNINTGEGVAWGTFVITDAQGTFEGMFRVKDTNFIQFTGTGEGLGTGAYEGMTIRLSFQGEDLYRAGYTGPDGLTMTYSGCMLSPKGI
jgi:hypothetical protein